MIKKKNKKGVMGIILFFLLLFTILIVGFIAAISMGVIDFASDTIVPVMTDLGVVGDTNVSEASEYTFGTVDTLVTALPWLIAFAYVAMLIFSIVFIVSWNYNPNPVFIGVYFMFVILLILGSIIMSNMYQDIREGDDIIGASLQSQTAMSFMLLHAPSILTLIVFIVGIYIFVGKENTTGGGFGV